MQRKWRTEMHSVPLVGLVAANLKKKNPIGTKFILRISVTVSCREEFRSQNA